MMVDFNRGAEHSRSRSYGEYLQQRVKPPGLKILANN